MANGILNEQNILRAEHKLLTYLLEARHETFEECHDVNNEEAMCIICGIQTMAQELLKVCRADYDAIENDWQAFIGSKPTGKDDEKFYEALKALGLFTQSDKPTEDEDDDAV